MKSMSLGQRFLAADNKPTGFDYIRLILASCIILQHSVNVTEGLEAAKALFYSKWRPLLQPILPMFFALSGFLVSGSLYRCKSLISFGGLRVMRIVPALLVEVILSALILGPLFTTLPLSEYFSSTAFKTYFLNSVGYIHYTLPGVFLHNPWPAIVNTQLWTVPYELECYVALSLLAFIGLLWKPSWFAGSLAIIQLALIAYFTTVSTFSLMVSGKLLVFSFLWGVAFYIYRDFITCDSKLFAIAIIVTAVLYTLRGGEYLATLPVVYITTYLGTLNPRKPKFFFSGDYSYGMYLYGFPIQQTLVALFPEMTVYGNMALSLILAFALAHFSWWFVEKPVLRLKPQLIKLEDTIFKWLPRILHKPIIFRPVQV